MLAFRPRYAFATAFAAAAAFAADIHSLHLQITPDFTDHPTCADDADFAAADFRHTPMPPAPLMPSCHDALQPRVAARALQRYGARLMRAYACW